LPTEFRLARQQSVPAASRTFPVRCISVFGTGYFEIDLNSPAPVRYPPANSQLFDEVILWH
jgi:hypothetical protein